MFPTGRHPTPVTNYNSYGHFSGYPQGSQYNPQSQDYNQFNVDANTSFSQAYNVYGVGSNSTASRPQGMDDWMNYSGMATTTASSLSPPSMQYSYRSGGMEYNQHPTSVPPGNSTLTVLGSPPQSEGSPTSSTSSPGSAGSPSNKQLRPPYDWMKKASYTACVPTAGK